MTGTSAGAAKAKALREARARQSEDVGPLAPSPGPHVFYVVGRRPIKDGKRVYLPGETFPKAASLLRLDGWLRTGMLIQMT